MKNPAETSLYDDSWNRLESMTVNFIVGYDADTVTLANSYESKPYIFFGT